LKFFQISLSHIVIKDRTYRTSYLMTFTCFRYRIVFLNVFFLFFYFCTKLLQTPFVSLAYNRSMVCTIREIVRPYTYILAAVRFRSTVVTTTKPRFTATACVVFTIIWLLLVTILVWKLSCSQFLVFSVATWLLFTNTWYQKSIVQSQLDSIDSTHNVAT